MTSTAKIAAGAATGLLFLTLASTLHPKPRLVWNPSRSAPIGLYRVATQAPPKRADLVVVEPPQPLAAYLERRGYLPKGVPLLKHIGAGPGQQVCRTGPDVTIDGRRAARALSRDHLGRPLPAWSGCVVLAKGQVFLLNPGVLDSLDGRYFGPIDIRQILGVAHPIWTRAGR